MFIRRTFLFLVIILFPLHLSAQSTTFNNTGTGAFGTIQTWTVPACVDSITIEVWGAQGGGGTAGPGSFGARMKGDFFVIAGQVLKILVGQQGTPCSSEGGGGGGTFVTDNLNNPLIIAGGGGGSSFGVSGTGGTTSTCGLNGVGIAASPGGCAGNGGGSVANASSGGGLLTDGGNDGNPSYSCTNLNGGGKSFINGGNGGTGTCPSCSGLTADGGFGGGGGTYGPGSIGGGGGGGYSGGGGGSNTSQTGGGGGGSYNGGINQSNSSDVQAGNGKAIITMLSYTITAITSFFTASTPVCEGVNSTITYIGSGAPGDTYNWNFDGGIVVSGSGQGPYTVNWATPGTKNITLTVNTNGCPSALTTVSVTVTTPPTSTFTASAPMCRNGIATITYTGDASSSANYFWNFDGGTIVSGSGQGPYTVSWSTAGTYNCTLTLTENGCPSLLTTVQQVVLPPPHANFSPVDVCLNQATNFIDLSTFSSGTITAWEWNFGNSSPLNNAQYPTFTFSNTGSYPVSLIATGSNGCTDTIFKTVVVHPLPQAQFSTTNTCQGNFTQFSDASIILNPDLIQSWTWNFGDGSSVNNQNTSHLYAGLGVYTVELLTISNFGCKDSVSKVITINPNPVVAFTANDTTGCEALCINFQNTSTPGTNVQWVWNFGDGSAVSTTQSPSYCFNNDSVFAPEAYSVSLTATSDSGCVSILNKNNYITVYPMPVATCVATEYYIIAGNTTLLNATGGGTYQWLPPVGLSCDTCQSTTASPVQTITYCVITTSINACSDSSCLTINVEKPCPADFTVPDAFSPNNDGHNDKFCLQGWVGCVKKFDILIFDRWGEKVYESNDPDFCWEGSYASAQLTSTPLSKRTDNPMNSAVFVYYIKATDLNGKEIIKKGNISLIR